MECRNVLKPCLDFSAKMVHDRKRKNHDIRIPENNDEEIIKLVGTKMLINRIKRSIKNNRHAQNSKRTSF